MYLCNGHGAFAYGGGYAFYRVVADIAGGKGAGFAGFEVIGQPVGGPCISKPRVTNEISSGNQVAYRATDDAGIYGPVGIGFATYANKEFIGIIPF